MKFLEIISTPNSSKFMRELAKAISLIVTHDNWEDTATVPPNLIFSDSNQVISPPLIGGDEIFSKHAELVLAAQREVLLQTFAYEAQSVAGQKFLESLRTLQEIHKNKQCEAIKKGETLSPIKVCVLVSKGTIFARKFMLMTSNVKSNWKPTKSEYDIGIEFEVDPTILNITVKIAFFKGAGLHSKSLIIDGKHAIITGSNFQARNHGPNASYDLGFSFSGDIANSLRTHFITTWNSKNSKSENGEETLLTINNNSTIEPEDGQEFLTQMDFKEISQLEQPIVIAARNVKTFPGSEKSVQNIAFRLAFANAKTYIHLISPNLNADLIKDLIISSVKRGVIVNIVLPKHFNDSRQKMIGGGGTNHTNVCKLYRRLEQKDHKNLNIKWYVGLNEKNRDKNKSLLHAKFSIFDNVCITGSTNLDRHSIYHGRELNIVVEDKKIVSEWNDKIFKPLFQRGQSVAEQYKDYKASRTDAIDYLQKFINTNIHARSEEKDRIDCLQKVRANLQKLDYLADKISNSNQVISPPLIGGDEIFSKHAELVLAAQREVLLQTFAYEAQSVAGQKFLESLRTLQEIHKNKQCEAIKKGETLSPIKVCVLVSKGTIFARKFMLMTSNVKSNWKPTKSEYDIGIEFEVDPTILNITVKIAFFKGAGLHSKSLIIDGKHAIITGSNFQARNHGPNASYDLGFSFSGDIANSLRTHFITTWNSKNSKSENGEETLLTINNNSTIEPEDGQEFLTQMDFKEISQLEQPIVIAARNVKTFPGSEKSVQNIAFRLAFANAKTYIHLISPNLNADLIKDLIISSVKRGRGQSVAEQYKDYKASRTDAIDYLQKFINTNIHARSEEKDRIDCLQKVRANLQKLDYLADKISSIRRKYMENNENRLSVINRLELFIVNAYNTLKESSLHDTPNNFLNNLKTRIIQQLEELLNLLKSLTEEVKNEHQCESKLSNFFYNRSRLASILESLTLDLEKISNDDLHPFSINHP
ncbi:hypothetical protein FQR65_LT05271 [Abscondita terminalis]|nr:hypothetical protein FQR65_LT05271 [Abscondita terminalis]